MTGFYLADSWPSSGSILDKKNVLIPCDNCQLIDPFPDVGLLPMVYRHCVLDLHLRAGLFSCRDLLLNSQLDYWISSFLFQVLVSFMLALRILELALHSFQTT